MPRKPTHPCFYVELDGVIEFQTDKLPYAFDYAEKHINKCDNIRVLHRQTYGRDTLLAYKKNNKLYKC